MKVYRSKKAENQIISTYDELLLLWQAGQKEHDIQGTYGTTHVITCGDDSSPPLILFHGVGDDAALMWLYNAKALSRHFRVIAIDTMGGPGKSRPNRQYNKTFDAAKWIDEVLDAFGVTKAYVAGVSNGAFLAQFYAVHRPERVDKIVCMAGTVPAGNASPMRTMMKVFLPEALFPSERNIIRLLEKLTGENSRVFTQNPLILAHYRALLTGFNNMAMAYHKVSGFSDEAISGLRDRALYLMGEEDPFAHLGGKAALIRYGMNAKFYPKVGHGINHEMADEINRQLITYFGAAEA